MWNAEVYNRYSRERMQPSIDLTARLNDKKFNRIIDVGCGTGMSTAAIKAIWNEAEIIGVDLSEEMLKQAKEMMPEVSFFQKDCSKSLSYLGSFDLIFSNAFIQWIPNQEEFIKKSFDLLNPGGTFAAQIPLFEEMPANQCIIKAEKLIDKKPDVVDHDKFVLHSASEYYDMLSKNTTKISLWITDYCHEMNHHNEILEFLKGAALRPYMDNLDAKVLKAFMDEVLKNIKKAYPGQKNGKVLFPFRRLFLIGEK